jgi:hypothetical protein
MISKTEMGGFLAEGIRSLLKRRKNARDNSNKLIINHIYEVLLSASQPSVTIFASPQEHRF